MSRVDEEIVAQWQEKLWQQNVELRTVLWALVQDAGGTVRVSRETLARPDLCELVTTVDPVADQLVVKARTRPDLRVTEDDSSKTGG